MYIYQVKGGKDIIYIQKEDTKKAGAKVSKKVKDYGNDPFLLRRQKNQKRFWKSTAS
jgi:hypothetical protein